MLWKRKNTGSFVLGADGQANYVLGLLARGMASGALETEVDLIPGVRLRADPKLKLSGQYRSPKGCLLELDAQMAAPGDWIALHIDLPAHDLSAFGVLGFALRASAPEMILLRASLRSGRPGEGFDDCFFDKHILLHPEEATHLDALPLPYRDTLPVTAPWRELILFLPTEAFHLSLVDLRLFIV